MTSQRPTAADAAARLDAFAARLAVLPDLEATITPSGLLVRNPSGRGCCDDVPFGPTDRITCKRRRDDGDALWFFTSWNEPIAPADDVVGASVRVLGYLAVES